MGIEHRIWWSSSDQINKIVVILCIISYCSSYYGPIADLCYNILFVFMLMFVWRGVEGIALSSYITCIWDSKPEICFCLLQCISRQSGATVLFTSTRGSVDSMCDSLRAVIIVTQMFAPSLTAIYQHFPSITYFL